MGVLDLILGIFLSYGIYKGFRSGLLMNLVSFLSFFIALVATSNFSGRISTYYIQKYPEYDQIIPITVFIAFGLAVVIALILVGKALKKVIDLTLLGSFDNLAGALFGLFKWAFILSTIIWLVGFAGVDISDNYSGESTLYGFVEPVAPFIFENIGRVIPIINEWLEPLKNLDLKEKGYYTSLF